MNPTLSIKLLLTTGLFFFLGLEFLWSQPNDLERFYWESKRTQEVGMAVLGGWALANMSLWAYAWSQENGVPKYFGQMNFFWNTVNLSIAGFALWNQSQGIFEESSVLSEHRKTENILLINAAVLDVAYIASGIYLLHRSKKPGAKKSDMLQGYGRSLILQGGFLMIFDFVLYGILRSQSMSWSESLSMQFGGTSASLVYFF